MGGILPQKLSKRGAEKRRAWRKSMRLRHFRYVSFSQEVWRRRLVFLAGAVAVGVTAVGFAKCADWAQDVYRSLTGAWPLLPLVMTPIGFAVLAYITRRWVPAAAGSGIPQVIAARKSPDERHRLCLLGFPVMIAKMVMTTAALVIGASVGREGPTVQVGASVMFAVAGVAGIGRHNGLVLAGSGAGIAAAFNAPLAGIVFAIEELAKAFTGRINEIIIGSVVIGGAVSWSILGNYPYFGEVSAHLGRSLDWLAVPVCAVLGGVLGGLFSRTMVAHHAHAAAVHRNSAPPSDAVRAPYADWRLAALASKHSGTPPEAVTGRRVPGLSRGRLCRGGSDLPSCSRPCCLR